MIRRSLLTAKIRAVWSKDPALDHAHPGFVEAWKVYEKMADPKDLPLKDGEKLTIFDCNPLTREDWLRTQGLNSRELADVVIAYTLQRVENYEGPDGRPFEIGKDDRTTDGAGSHVKREVLNLLYDPSIWDDVASMVLDHSRLNPTRGQG